MVISDLEVTRTQLCCCHSFLFPASVWFISKVRAELCCCRSFIYYQIINVNVSFISKVRVTGGPGGIVLLSFIPVPRQRVFHFKSEGGIVLLPVNCFQHQCVIPFNRVGHRWVFSCLPVFSARLSGCGSSD